MAVTAVTSSATLSLCSSFSSQCRLSVPRSQSSILSLPKPLYLSSAKKPCLRPLRASSSVIEFDPEAPPVGAEAEEVVAAEAEVEVEVQAPAEEPEASAEEQPAPTPKREEIFAVVIVGSRQYIVIPGRHITTQRLKGANVNDKIILNKVLLVGTRTTTYIGRPVVTNAAVHAIVEEQGLDKKVTIFKYKKKKKYRRNIGHRQPNTRIRITGITGYEDYPAVTLESAGLAEAAVA
ncbi:hypothetical protein MLD38_001094 [Melastoma candidum]|uniref:Uncharacterized protein n=1 Tax=Melastoma candidum TaxID=119954 RepID=A0ACB9SC29_9MYRT|nr:hypothetical protein MLD38_001094 [Melastoma candidum]